MAALGLAAVGSALGCGTAGMAAIGAWKKAYLKGKNALFTLLIFVGAPIAQTIYGMLLMMYILLSVKDDALGARNMLCTVREIRSVGACVEIICPVHSVFLS